LLGASLVGQKRYADAEPLLLAAWQGMEARVKEIPADQLQHTLESLVQLYEHKGDSARSAWKLKLEQWQQTHPARLR
jgi:hypothetical protein